MERRSSGRIGTRSALSVSGLHRPDVDARVRAALAAMLCAALCVAALLAPAAAAANPGGASAKPAPGATGRGPIPIAVSADASEPGAPVPQSFLGLSFEVGSLSRIA